MKESEKLMDIEKRWLKVFKTSELEDLWEKCHSIKEFENVLINECFPMWLQENEGEEKKELLKFFKEVKELDFIKIKYEIELYHNVSMSLDEVAMVVKKSLRKKFNKETTTKLIKVFNGDYDLIIEYLGNTYDVSFA